MTPDGDSYQLDAAATEAFENVQASGSTADDSDEGYSPAHDFLVLETVAMLGMLIVFAAVIAIG